MRKLFNLFLIILIIAAAYSYATLPSIAKMDSCFTTTMNKVALCSKSPKYVRLSLISPNIKNAIIISEDTAFYSHHGFDFDELKNSFIKNLKKMSFARGGSTITQQLAKNLYLTNDKTLTRKLKELILTKRIEEKYSKNDILEKYLNVIEFGQNIYGIKSATEYYFQKPPQMVTALEAAFIAFLLPNPKKYAVSFKKKELTPFARSRIKDILYKMFAYRKIQEGEYNSAKAQLQVMFKSIPKMEDEPTDEEVSSSEYDMTELRKEQSKSIEKLEANPEPESSPDAIYPDEIPASDIYDVNKPSN